MLSPNWSTVTDAIAVLYVILKLNQGESGPCWLYPGQQVQLNVFPLQVKVTEFSWLSSAQTMLTAQT